MVKRIILGGILGGILLFNWGYVAHMLLPLGEMGVHVFPDEAAVVGPIRARSRSRGSTCYPGMDMSGKASESEQKAWAEKAKQGPVGVLIVRPQGSEFVMLHKLGTELGDEHRLRTPGGILLAQVRVGAGYWTRVGFVTLLGVLAFVTIIVPYWNWYSFPADFVAGEAIEHAVGWFLAGLVLAAIVRTAREQGGRVESTRHFDGVTRRCERPASPSPGLLLGRLRLVGGRMVVHDLPALGKFAEDHGKQAARRGAVGHGQLPSAPRQDGLRPERLDVERRERQPAHRAAFRLVAPPITIAHRLPAVEALAARLEDHLRRVPVAGEEAVEIALVPIGDLTIQDGTARSAWTPPGRPLPVPAMRSTPCATDDPAEPEPFSSRRHRKLLRLTSRLVIGPIMQ